jgi:hypothetical protein
MTFPRSLLAAALAASIAMPSRHADACGDSLPSTPVVFASRPYTEVSMQTALVALTLCEKTHGECEPANVIASWGANAVPALLTRLKQRPSDHRALELIKRAKVAGSGLKLLALVRTATSPKTLYQAAVEIDGKRAFDELARRLDQTTQDEAARDIFYGMQTRRDDALTYVVKMLPRSPDPVRLADFAYELSDDTTGETMRRLLGKTTDPRAKTRLALAAMRANGGAQSAELWDVLADGLTSNDATIRKDTHDHFPVYLVPAAERARFLAIYEADIANGRRTLDHNTGIDMLKLGSREEAILELLFGGLDSKQQPVRFRAANDARRLADRLPADVKARVVTRIEAVLPDADAKFRKYLDRALDALRK